MLSSLRFKIIFLTIVPTTLIYFTILFFSLFRFEENATDDITREMHQYTQYYASYYASFLRETMQIANTSASFLQQNLQLGKNQLYAMVKKNVELNPLVYGSAIAFDYEHLSNKQLFFAPYAYRTRNGVKTINIAMVSDYTKAHWEWWNRVVRERKPIWTYPFFSKEKDNVLMSTYAVPFYDKGELIGVTTVDVALSPLEKNVSQLLPSDFEFVIITRKGEYLYDRNRENILRRSLIEDAQAANNIEMKLLGEAMTQGKTGMIKLNGWKDSNEKEWVFYRPIPQTEWSLAVRVKEQKILQKSREDTIIIALVLLASLAVIVLVIWLVIGRITAPLVRLTQNVKEITSGNMDTIIEQGGNDEIGILARTFQQMTRDLQKREEDLRQARSRGFSQIVSHLSGKYIYFTQNLQGQLTYVSAEIESILGYSCESFIENFQQYLSANPINRTFIRKNILLLNGRQQDAMEVELVSAKGKLHRFEVIQVPVVDENNHIIAAEGMAHDITERRMEEEKFRVLFESSFEANILFDSYRIIDCNQAFLDLFQFESKEEVLKNSPCQLCDEYQSNGLKSQQLMLEAMENARQQQSFKLAIEFKRSDQHIFPTEMSITSVVISDNLFYIGIIHDMTERIRAEQEIIAAKEQAEKANKAKSDFLSNMSHELRTPLNGVLGYAQILLNQPDTTPQQSKSLDAIESCGRHLLTLINDVLDLSKIESGKLEITETTFDLRRFVNDIYNIVSPKAEMKNLQVKLLLDEKLPPYIKTDATKLSQILVNLMGNAIKFTEQGEVSLELTLLDQQGEPHDPTQAHMPQSFPQKAIRFKVQDTGIGIAKEKQQEIFEAFKQAQEGMAVEGTGLGLAISKRLAEILGFSPIHLQSDEGKGSCFSFVMPLKKIDREEIYKDSNFPDNLIPQIKSVTTVCALVVDDRKTNRDILCGMLEIAGFEVSQCDAGEQAVQLAQENRFDMIFMDIQMPGMDGIEASWRIRKLPAYEQAVIFAVTANALPAHAISNFNEVIHKPVRSSELFAKIEKFAHFELIKEAARTDEDTELATAAADNGNMSLDTDNQREIQSFIEQLEQASDYGDIAQLQKLLAKARQFLSQPQLKTLEQLIQQFDFDKISAFVHKLQSEDAKTSKKTSAKS